MLSPIYPLILITIPQITLTKQLCPENLSLEISSGSFNKNTKSFSYQNMTFPPETYYRYGDIIRGCVCLIKTCVNACCPKGQDKVSGECAKTDWELELNVYKKTVFEKRGDVYSLVIQQQRCSAIIFSQFENNEEVFFLQKNGSVFLGESYLNFDQYCVTRYTNNSDLPQINVCADSVMEDGDIINVYGMIISIPFLIVTLIVYCLLPPNKRNVGIKCQMAYVFSLMCAYLFLVIIDLNSLESAVCTTLATLCLYSFMSSFCWMNISCIDIYLTFSGKNRYRHGLDNKKRTKQFYFYCLYAYGFPLSLVTIIFGINILEDQNLWYHPNFGTTMCWLKKGFPLLLYFYGPLGILLACNITLFTLTALKIKKLERESSMIWEHDNKKHYEKDRQRFIVYFKLLIVLGINWALEFLSWVVDWSFGAKKFSTVLYVTDFCNAICGVIIFYLFVCKKSTWIMLKKRYYTFRGQPEKAGTITTRS